MLEEDKVSGLSLYVDRVQDRRVMTPPLEFEALDAWHDLGDIFFLLEDAERQDEARIHRGDAFEAMVAALVHVDYVIAELRVTHEGRVALNKTSVNIGEVGVKRGSAAHEVYLLEGPTLRGAWKPPKLRH